MLLGDLGAHFMIPLDWLEMLENPPGSWMMRDTYKLVDKVFDGDIDTASIEEDLSL